MSVSVLLWVGYKLARFIQQERRLLSNLQQHLLAVPGCMNMKSAFCKSSLHPFSK